MIGVSRPMIDVRRLTIGVRRLTIGLCRHTIGARTLTIGVRRHAIAMCRLTIDVRRHTIDRRCPMIHVPSLAAVVHSYTTTRRPILEDRRPILDGARRSDRCVDVAFTVHDGYPERTC